MSRETARADFTPARLQRLIEIDPAHFWFRGRRKLVDRLIGAFDRSGPRAVREVLDLGPGSGSLSRSLAADGFKVTALDFLPEGLRSIKRSNPGILAVQSSAERLALRSSSLDAALALDVLEHLDDAAALGELRRVLRPGGWLVITVPAFPFLWSHRDEAAGHRRRYTRGVLAERLAAAGFAIERAGYYQFFLFPLAAFTRWLGKVSPAARDREDAPPPLLNALFTAVNQAEVTLGRFVPWPFGSSLWVVARAPEASK